MDSKKESNEKEKTIEKKVNRQSILDNVKSNYTLSKISGFFKKNKLLKIIQHNKEIQKRLNININNYIEYRDIYTKIELELIPKENRYGEIITPLNKADEKYYHIYFDDNKEERMRTFLDEKEKPKRIKLIIDYQIKSLKNLFSQCSFIESINFKRFYRNNIDDMSNMFMGCSSLKEIKFDTFNTDNVNDMSDMFRECSSLKKLDLSKFNTNKVTKMKEMFYDCRALKEINIPNFNINDVMDMNYMFFNCESLEEVILIILIAKKM